MKRNLYNYNMKVYYEKEKEQQKILEQYSKFELIQSQVENKKYKIIDKTNSENFKFSSIYFYRYFINEVKTLFSPLEIEYINDEIIIINKNELLEKLEDKTFDFFKKYPNKIEEMNSILNDMKQGLKYENFEQEIDEGSIYPYIFKVKKFITNNSIKKFENKSPEIISGYNVPTTINYSTQKVYRKKIKINFEEKLDENKVSLEEIKFEFKKEFKLPETELFEFDFIIKGYYIYNTETETVEKIEVDKEIKFYNVTTWTKRVLELEGFDENEKDEGRTYDEAIGELFEYLDKMGRKKEIDRQEFENFVDGIAFSEKPKIFKTLKWYIETNKIGFLELIEGERDRIYISEKEVLKVFEEIFDM